MKKLLFLLIPLFAFSQITYKDIMNLDDKNSFIKLMFDKQFTSIENEDSVSDQYALNPDSEGNANQFSWYFNDTDFFFFQFIRTGLVPNYVTGRPREIVIENDYDNILKKVKRKCKFIKMYKVEKQNYACYECKEANFDDYLGFVVVGNAGIITQLRNIEIEFD